MEIEGKVGENKGVGMAQTTPNHIDGIGGAEDMTTPTSKRTTGPAFQFYPKDFLSSSRVQRMTLTEIGIYIVLLSHAWLAGGIPAEPDQIAKLVKMPAARFRRLWDGPLSECFKKRGGLLVNERLDLERQKQIDFRERASVAGKKGGRRVPLPDPSPTIKGTPSTRVMESGECRSETLQSSEESEERLDVEFQKFQAVYPGARRKGGRLIEELFLDAVRKAGGVSRLLAALANHVGSDQWANPRLIPGMDVWLKEERWRQELPAAGAVTSSANNPKTAGNVPAFQRFIDRGRTA